MAATSQALRRGLESVPDAPVHTNAILLRFGVSSVRILLFIEGINPPRFAASDLEWNEVAGNGSCGSWRDFVTKGDGTPRHTDSLPPRRIVAEPQADFLRRH